MIDDLRLFAFLITTLLILPAILSNINFKKVKKLLKRKFKKHCRIIYLSKNITIK